MHQSATHAAATIPSPVKIPATNIKPRMTTTVPRGTIGVMDLTDHLRALDVYRETYLGHPDADRIVDGALWAFARMSGESTEVLRSRMVASRPTVPEVIPVERDPRRLYAPVRGGVELRVVKEAVSLAVDPQAPVAEPNPRSFSALATDPDPITDEDRAYLDSLPELTAEQIAAQIAAVKSPLRAP